jgi:hypothetical protein
MNTGKRTFVAFVVMVAVQVGLVAATQAGAAQKPADEGYGIAKFKAEVKGKQTYTSEYHHAAYGSCDVNMDESTGETVKFKSTKPVTVTAYIGPDDKYPSLLGGKGALVFPTKAVVSRNRSYAAGTTNDPSCDNGGGVTTPTPPPDCGTKATSWKLGVDYYKGDQLEIQPTNLNAEDPFLNCGSGKFPYLIGSEAFGSSQPAELPEDELFDSKIGKLITIGRSSSSIVGPEGYDDAKLKWELSLTRIKDK